MCWGEGEQGSMFLLKSDRFDVKAPRGCVSPPGPAPLLIPGEEEVLGQHLLESLPLCQEKLDIIE